MSCEVQNKLLSSITSIAINYIDQIFTSYSGSEDMCLTMLRSLNLEVSPIAIDWASNVLSLYLYTD